jgi:hypothetical protein
MSLLFSLPVEMLRTILHYLLPKDIGTLDNATTNQRDRMSLLMVLEKFAFQIFPQHEKKLDSKMRWCLLRGTLIRNFFLNPNLDHVGWPELIRRSQEIVESISLHDFDFLNSLHFELLSALGLCSNVSSLVLYSCEISDSLFESSFSKLKNLEDLHWSPSSQLTSLSLLSLVAYYPKLQSLVCHNDVQPVSDQELRAILEGCQSLKILSFDQVNFTDESIGLLIETNRRKKVTVTWGSCPRVTWEHRLLYLRAISLDQLCSEDVKQQTAAISTFGSMIPSDSTFSIEQYASLGLFDRIHELLSKLTEGKQDLRSSNRQLAHSIIRIFDQLVELGHVAFLIERGLVELVIDLNFARDDFLDLFRWLHLLIKICAGQGEYLLSIGILSQLVRVGQVRQVPLLILSPPSTSSIVPSPIYCSCT